MKKNKAPRLLTVAIFTTITIVFWIFYSVYQVLTSKPDVNVPPDILSPFAPNLDTQTLSELQSKLHYEESDVDFVSPTTSTPTPEAVTADEQPQITQTPNSATVSATPSQ